MSKTANILAFLTKLQENNNREWFNANKDEFLSVKQDFETLTQEFITALEIEDELIKNVTPKECVFRIYRDVRFGKNKSPYKNHFGAYINQGGRKGPTCGYYIHIEPGATMIAGGLYTPPSPILFEARDAIYADAEDFKAIINSKSFKDTFGEMEGEKLKRGPKDFPKDFEDIELLKHKSFVATRYVSDEELISKDFFEKTMDTCRAMKPFNDFFNRAILAMD